MCFQPPMLLQATIGHVRSPVVAFLWVDMGHDIDAAAGGERDDNPDGPRRLRSCTVVTAVASRIN